MKYLMLVVVIAVSSFLAEKSEGTELGFAPLQARRIAGQNIRRSAQVGRAQAVQAPRSLCVGPHCGPQAVVVERLIVPAPVQTRTIVVRQSITY